MAEFSVNFAPDSSDKSGLTSTRSKARRQPVSMISSISVSASRKVNPA